MTYHIRGSLSLALATSSSIHVVCRLSVLTICLVDEVQREEVCTWRVLLCAVSWLRQTKPFCRVREKTILNLSSRLLAEEKSTGGGLDENAAYKVSF
jgi:hypothetical protein